MSINIKISKHFLNLCVVLLLVLGTILPVMAEENIISSVVISKSKTKQNAYELSIDSSKTVDYKTNIDDDGSIYFDLKNSTLSNDAGTVYDDVTDIDSVVVRQLDKNRVRIYVAGKNAKNTELMFVNSLFETQQQPKKIVINRPVDTYKSTSSSEEADDLESQEDIQEWNDNSFNLYHFISETLSGAKESATGIILIIASILVFVFITIKTITSKISQDSEPLIGLNTAKNAMDEDFYSSAIQKPATKEAYSKMNDIASRTQMLSKAQEELAKAHNKYQAYLQNKYKNTSYTPKKIDSDTLKQAMALNQYKKNEKNPYLDQEVIKMDKINSYNTGQGLIPPRPKKQNVSLNTSPYIQKPTPKINYKPKSNDNNNSTSLKFLESVSKIYEQSGREDLAMGLKKSIAKSR